MNIDRVQLEALNAQMNREAEFHLRNRSSLHLEAAIGSMLDCYTVAETAKRLRFEADHLEQFG